MADNHNCSLPAITAVSGMEQAAKCTPEITLNPFTLEKVGTTGMDFFAVCFVVDLERCSNS